MPAPVTPRYMDLIENTATVPLLPTGGDDFWDLVLSQPSPLDKPRRTGDPLWAIVCLIVGAFLSIGAGMYLIVLGVQG